MPLIPSEACAHCHHEDWDHLDGGMCQVFGCLCEEFLWVEELEDFSGASYLDGTNNER